MGSTNPSLRQDSAPDAKSPDARADAHDRPPAARIQAVLHAALGHPALVNADWDEGTGVLTLSGTVFDHELEPLLEKLRALAFVREVRATLNPVHLDALASIPRGEETESFNYESHYLEDSWPPAFRLGLGGISALALLRGVRRKGAAGTVFAAAGLALLSRAVFNRDLAQLFGSLVLPVIRIHRTVEVGAAVEDCYDFWRRFDNYKLFMSFIEDVTVGDNGCLHWIARLPGRTRLHWDSQVTALRPLQRIAWKSVSRALIANAGVIDFEPLGPARTRIRIELSYIPPAGALGYLFARSLGFDPGHRIDEDLEAMRLLLERPARPHSETEPPRPPSQGSEAA